MSKIEVLRVPDERQYTGDLPDGSLVILVPGGGWKLAAMPDEKPALLAALLEDAGYRAVYAAVSSEGSVIARNAELDVQRVIADLDGFEGEWRSLRIFVPEGAEE